MDFMIDRRSALKAGAALAAAYALPAGAQAKPTLRFAAVFSDKDIRAGMIQMFAKEVGGDFEVEPFYNGSLFKQGTELVALQRDNLEMGNIAPQDKLLIDDQQRNVDARPEQRMLDNAADAGVVLARRIVERLLAEEASRSAGTRA